MDWMYDMCKWTWVFVSTWYGNLIWGVWLGINVLFFAINLFYPLVNAYAGGNDRDLKWNPILALLLQALLFVFVLWAGNIFYK